MGEDGVRIVVLPLPIGAAATGGGCFDTGPTSMYVHCSTVPANSGPAMISDRRGREVPPLHYRNSEGYIEPVPIYN